MERSGGLQQHEHHACEDQGAGRRLSALDAADDDAHCDAEHGGKYPTQHQDSPPDAGQQRIGHGQHAEELPFASRAQTLKHAGDFSRLVKVQRAECWCRVLAAGCW